MKNSGVLHDLISQLLQVATWKLISDTSGVVYARQMDDDEGQWDTISTEVGVKGSENYAFGFWDNGLGC